MLVDLLPLVLLRFRLADDEQDYRRVISTVAATGRLEGFSPSWVVTSLVPCQRFTTVVAERCRRPCAVAAEAKYNIKDVAASNKKWTVYELAVQNFLMDAHRDGCVFGSLFLLCRLLRYFVISSSGTVTVTVTDLTGHLSSTTSVGHPSRRVTTVFAQDHSCSDSWNLQIYIQSNL